MPLSACRCSPSGVSSPHVLPPIATPDRPVSAVFARPVSPPGLSSPTGFLEVDFSSEFDFTDQMSPAMEQLSILTPDSDPIPEDQMDLAEQARQDQFFADAHAKCDAQLEEVEQLEEPRVHPSIRFAEQARQRRIAFSVHNSLRATRIRKEVLQAINARLGGNCACSGRISLRDDSVECECGATDNIRFGCTLGPTELDHSPCAPSLYPSLPPGFDTASQLLVFAGVCWCLLDAFTGAAGHMQQTQERNDAEELGHWKTEECSARRNSLLKTIDLNCGQIASRSI